MKSPLIALGIIIIFVVGVWAFIKNNPGTTKDQDSGTSNQTIATDSASSQSEGEQMKELKKEDIKVGEGAEAVNGKTAVVHYTGTLEDGTKFDSSRDRGEPFEFPLGQGMVIPGWEQGIQGMKVGGQRKLTIPPALGYGEQGVPPTIPGNSTLLFDVELLEVK